MKNSNSSETKVKQKRNSYMLRIQDKGLQEVIDQLIATKMFESANILLNKILQEGISKFSKLYLKKDIQPTEMQQDALSPDIYRSIKQIENTTDDIFVMINLIETLLATIYNAKVMEVDGKRVTGEMIESGQLSMLPSSLQEIKDEIINALTKRSK